MSFRSILFDGAESPIAPVDQEPAYFADLNLSQVAESITASRKEYDLKPFFYTRLTTPEAITYRHEVLRDLEGDELAAQIASFAQKMHQMREHLTRAPKTHYESEQQVWFLHAVRTYCDAVGQLAADLADASVRSQGLQAFRDYLADFIQRKEFTTLRDDARRVSEALAAARYCLHIKGSRVTVSPYDGQGDYSAEIAETFSKFKQGPATDRRIRGSRTREMNDVEARVLEVVARWYPDAFSALSAYCECNHDYLDATITTFDREVQFYLGLLEYVERLRSAGLPMCSRA